MKHLAKRTLSLLLAALMVLSLIPAHTHVHAAEVTTAYYGADNTKDTNLTTTEEHSYGTVKNYVGSHSAWALKSGGMGLVLSEAFREGFNGKATVEVEYLSASTFSSTFDLQYIANDGSAKTPTEYTTKDGTTQAGQAAKIRVYELTDMGTTLGTIGSVTKPSSLAVTTDDTKYVGIRSIRVTKFADAPAYAPEFNNADFGGAYVFDQVASPALTVKNPYEDVEMTARIFVTLKKNGVDVEGLVQKRLRRHEDGAISTTDPVDVISSATMTDSTSAEGTYDLVVTSVIKVNGGDEVQIDKTLSFKRATTFTHEVVETNGSVFYNANPVDGAPAAVVPNGIKVYIENAEGDTVVGPVEQGVTLITETTKGVSLNLKELIKDLDYGTYTIKVEAYKVSGEEKTLRGTTTYKYTIAEPVAFAPEFNNNQFKAVYDSAALANLFIQNPHETAAMTTNITLTIKKGGVALDGANEVPVKTGTVVEAGKNTILVSSKDLSDRITEVGVEYEIVLGGTVTVDSVDYPVNHTIKVTRQATFEQRFFELNGITGFGVKLTSDAAADNAPKYFKFTVLDNEGNETGSYVADESVLAYNTTETQVQMKNLTIVSSLQPGTYPLKAEAYKNVELTDLRGTVTCEYIVECKHPGVSDVGDCTATTQVTCPDCEQTVTVKAGHTWGQYTYNEDATCVADGTKTASCTVDGCTAKDTVTAEGTKDPDAHKMELTTPEVPAQCGKAGTTAIYTCANGCDHTTGGEPIEALEHVYDNAEDNTCNLCGYVRAIDGGNLDLGNTMDYNVYVTLDPEKAEDAYAVIKKNGVVVEDDAKLEENGGSYEITLPGLAAKELCEGFTVEIYDKDGNKIGEAEESFAAYATRLFTKSSNEAAKRMIADMIVYATKAQQHFGYKTNDLLANQIDENLYKNYVTNYSEENVADRVVTQESKYYFGTNFELEKNISMNMFVANIEGGYGVFSFTDGEGNTKYEEQRINADNEKMSGDYYIFNINKFVTADGHDVTVTARFYDANGTLVATVSDSMASYVARMNDQYPWLEYMMTFATSTYNYKSSK